MWCWRCPRSSCCSPGSTATTTRPGALWHRPNPRRPRARPTAVVVPVTGVSRLAQYGFRRRSHQRARAVTVVPQRRGRGIERVRELQRQWTRWNPGVPCGCWGTEYASGRPAHRGFRGQVAPPLQPAGHRADPGGAARPGCVTGSCTTTSTRSSQGIAVPADVTSPASRCGASWPRRALRTPVSGSRAQARPAAAATSPGMRATMRWRNAGVSQLN